MIRQAACALTIALIAALSSLHTAAKADTVCGPGYHHSGETREVTATEIIIHPVCDPDQEPLNAAESKFCAAKLKTVADERAIQQMNFTNDVHGFEMFADVSQTQKEELQGKVIDALLDQGFEATTMAADSARSLNPINVNGAIKKLRASTPAWLQSQVLETGLRKIAAANGKPGMAVAYKNFVEDIKNMKEVADTGVDMSEDQKNAKLRLALGLLKIAQKDPDLGVLVTSVEFGESLAYLGYISSNVDHLTSVTDSKLLQLNSYTIRLKQDVNKLHSDKQAWAEATGNRGEPNCQN